MKFLNSPMDIMLDDLPSLVDELEAQSIQNGPLIPSHSHTTFFFISFSINMSTSKILSSSFLTKKFWSEIHVVDNYFEELCKLMMQFANVLILKTKCVFTTRNFPNTYRHFQGRSLKMWVIILYLQTFDKLWVQVLAYYYKCLI